MARPINTKLQKIRILRGALDLLEDGAAWTKHKNWGKRVRKPKAPGYPVASRGTAPGMADSYCLVGAVIESARNKGFEMWNAHKAVSLYDLVTQENNVEHVEQWNDDPKRRFEDIKDVIERRIAELEKSL